VHCRLPAGKPLGSQQRQKHFDKPSQLAAVHFDSEHVYTFVIGQGILDMMQYRLSLGGLLNLDLCPILNGQPLQMMCKNIKVSSSGSDTDDCRDNPCAPISMRAYISSLESG
jgi:hypothetical protein